MTQLPDIASALVINTYGLFDPPNVLPDAWYCAKVPKTDHYYYFNRKTGKRTWQLNDLVADSKNKRGKYCNLNIGHPLILPWPNAPPIVPIRLEISKPDIYLNINTNANANANSNANTNIRPKRNIQLLSPKRIVIKFGICIACFFAVSNIFFCLITKIF